MVLDQLKEGRNGVQANHVDRGRGLYTRRASDVPTVLPYQTAEKADAQETGANSEPNDKMKTMRQARSDLLF